MPKQIIIAEQHRIAAVFSEDHIQELIVATGSHQVGDIYLGIIENVLPGIDAAFVNLGDTERNGFIHVSDLGPVRLKRSAGSITELVAPQQKVLVQVMKEPTGTKGPRLTGNISMPGRYLVLMSSGRGVNLSRRIRNEEERSRLRALGILIKPAGMGLLVRTEAEGVSEDAIIEDLEFLQRQWESVQQQVISTRAPALLNRDDDFIQRVVRDVYTNDVNRIVVDSAKGLKRVKQHLMNWNANQLPSGVLIDQHEEPTSILEYFRVNAAIREALKPRVDLPSGGYIIIERTEALTVIDVNSGSFTRSATARETVLWTNCEAAAEIARQLRLRNIAGVIIVDFIDMDSRRDQLQLLEHFNKALKADKARPQIAQLSELGLVELTRKRQGQNIYELFGQACPTCGGLGHLSHLPGESSTTASSLGARPGTAASSYGATGTPAPVLPVALGRQASLDPSENLQELDISNHPSYQEQGMRRRRGRRARLGDSLSRESISPRMVRQGASAKKRSLDPSALAGSGGRGTADDPRTLEETQPPRRRGRQKREAPLPPEVVTVSMTPQEQEVYALMGVSPIVLFDGEVRNPAAAVVNVTLPGEGGAVASVETRSPESTAAPEAAEGDASATVALVNGDMPGNGEASGGTDSVPVGSARPANRRRRRRSSAATSQQLSLET